MGPKLSKQLSKWYVIKPMQKAILITIRDMQIKSISVDWPSYKRQEINKNVGEDVEKSIHFILWAGHVD